MTYNSLQGIFTTMIGFVTWPPYKNKGHLIKDDSAKGGQVTKPIIVVKMPCKQVCHSSKRILNKMFNFLALLDIRVFGRL